MARGRRIAGRARRATGRRLVPSNCCSSLHAPRPSGRATNPARRGLSSALRRARDDRASGRARLKLGRAGAERPGRLPRALERALGDPDRLGELEL
eukprot:4795635-Alexandrium_andersonii.AAC.1